MGILEWEEAFEIGVEELDNQHHRWLEMINDFIDCFHMHGANECLEIHLYKLMEYTRFHFSEEEFLLGRIPDSNRESQKAMHKRIIRRIREFQMRLREGTLVSETEVLTELESWLHEHIVLGDTKDSLAYQMCFTISA